MVGFGQILCYVMLCYKQLHGRMPSVYQPKAHSSYRRLSQGAPGTVQGPGLTRYSQGASDPHRASSADGRLVGRLIDCGTNQSVKRPEASRGLVGRLIDCGANQSIKRPEASRGLGQHALHPLAVLAEDL